MKKCKVCKEPFEQKNSLQVICCAECAYKYVVIKHELHKKNIDKIDRKIIKAAKDKLKTRGERLKEVQIVFNSYIRLRDKSKGYGCISCGAKNGKENCGHYRSVGSAPELRFCEENTALQCEKCNTYLHGNLISYRIELVKRIGIEKVDWLEGKHETKKYTKDELINLKNKYREKIKQLGK